MKYFILLLTILSAHADIFDHDDRLHTKDAPLEVQEIGKSVGALIRKTNLKINENGDYQLKGISLIDKLNFCPDERFSHESIIANCSGALVGKDTFLTAAHCIDERNSASCESYAVSFDYTTQSNGQKNFISKRENTYFCKRVLKVMADKHYMGRDLIMIQLDRKVNRVPVTIRKDRPHFEEEIFMIGYPFGISQKYTHNGIIEKNDSLPESFVHHLDSFSVNSGSPIFSAENGDLIGVLVRGTGMNYKSDNECNRWGIESSVNGYAIGNYINNFFK